MADNYVLIGYMGAGKTTVGKALAKETGKKFLDTDNLIVNEMNLSVNDIFEKYGEAYFRDLETKLIKNLCETANNCVISCGGGLPMREENRTYLKRLGRVIYLNVNETDIIRRLRGDKTRPLLRGDREEVTKRIHDMLALRDPVYAEAADTVIKTGRLKIPQIIERIIKE